MDVMQNTVSNPRLYKTTGRDNYNLFCKVQITEVAQRGEREALTSPSQFLVLLAQYIQQTWPTFSLKIGRMFATLVLVFLTISL